MLDCLLQSTCAPKIYLRILQLEMVTRAGIAKLRRAKNSLKLSGSGRLAPSGSGVQESPGRSEIRAQCATYGDMSHSTTEELESERNNDGNNGDPVGNTVLEGVESGLSSEEVVDAPMAPEASCPTLSHRRKGRESLRREINSGLPVRAPNRVQSAIQTTSSQEHDDLQVAHNRVKLDLLEALRDKKAYSSALAALQEQKNNMDKDMRILRQKNNALESTFKSAQRTKSGKKPVWSMENLRDTSIGNYQGICLSAGEFAKKEAMLLTTETYIDENDNGIRKRNWTGSVTKVTSIENTTDPQYVSLPDGSIGVPTSCMYRAKNYDHFVSPFLNEKGFANHCIEKTLDSPVGSMMTNEEKQTCISLILTHRQTIKKFKSIISDSIGNRKKITFSTFLRSLGYVNGAKSNSDKLTSSQKAARSLERQIAYDKCFKPDDNGTADTMYWRISEWSDLCLDASVGSAVAREMEQVEKAMEREDKVDNLFMNEAARRAFIDLRGHQVSESSTLYRADVSIISLARSDAAMTTMLKWIKVGGRGGVRNANLNECFRELLPKAMDAIIKEVWDDLKSLAPHELSLPVAGVEGMESDLGNGSREWTWAFKSPEDNNVYLMTTPKYFSEKVCFWIGNVRDCCIGVCPPNQSTFKRINVDTSVSEVEESDIDEEINASIACSNEIN